MSIIYSLESSGILNNISYGAQSNAYSFSKLYLLCFAYFTTTNVLEVLILNINRMEFWKCCQLQLSIKLKDGLQQMTWIHTNMVLSFSFLFSDPSISWFQIRQKALAGSLFCPKRHIIYFVKQKCHVHNVPTGFRIPHIKPDICLLLPVTIMAIFQPSFICLTIQFSFQIHLTPYFPIKLFTSYPILDIRKELPVKCYSYSRMLCCSSPVQQWSVFGSWTDEMSMPPHRTDNCYIPRIIYSTEESECSDLSVISTTTFLFAGYVSLQSKTKPVVFLQSSHLFLCRILTWYSTLSIIFTLCSSTRKDLYFLK